MNTAARAAIEIHAVPPVVTDPESAARIAAVRSMECLAEQLGSVRKAEASVREQFGLTVNEFKAWKREAQRELDSMLPMLRLTLADGEVLSYSAETDPRVSDVIDEKVLTTSLEGAETLAAELQCFGVTTARAFGFAVVFWG
jgi:hypothetical protein